MGIHSIFLQDLGFAHGAYDSRLYTCQTRLLAIAGLDLEHQNAVIRDVLEVSTADIVQAIFQCQMLYAAIERNVEQLVQSMAKSWQDIDRRSIFPFEREVSMIRKGFPAKLETNLLDICQKLIGGAIAWRDADQLSYQISLIYEGTISTLRQTRYCLVIRAIISTWRAIGHLWYYEDTCAISLTYSQISNEQKHSALDFTDNSTDKGLSPINERVTSASLSLLNGSNLESASSQQVGEQASTSGNACLANSDELEKEVDEYWTWNSEKQKFVHVDDDTGKMVCHPDEFD
ncbi:hypothetical protein GGR52DRAFT_554323 [Hypoxylon sp. FL1284]|nr:hypothetical protein GGR52DRAFT_554323 [Hypoxylon sp. FL1284]